MSPTAVLATLVSPDGRRDDVLAALQSLAAASADEPGTALFLVTERRDAPGTFTVLEQYRDDEAVRAHRTSGAMEAFREALQELRLRPDLVFLDPVS